MPEGDIIGPITMKPPFPEQEDIKRDPSMIHARGDSLIMRPRASATAKGAHSSRHMNLKKPTSENARPVHAPKGYRQGMRLRRNNTDRMILLVEGTE